MSSENYTVLKEQLYSKAAFDFSSSTIGALTFDSSHNQEELMANSCKGSAGTVGTYGSLCGCLGTFGSFGSYGCGS